MPMEVVESLSLEVFKNPVDVALEGCGQCAWWGWLGLELGTLEVFSNLNDSKGVPRWLLPMD